VCLRQQGTYGFFVCEFLRYAQKLAHNHILWLALRAIARNASHDYTKAARARS